MPTRHASLRLAFALLALGCLLCCSGCVTGSWEFYVNGDGSGKVTLKAELSQEMLQYLQVSSQAGPDDYGMGMMNQQPVVYGTKKEAGKGAYLFLNSLSGFEAWKDIDWSIDEIDKSLTVTATGYFKDVAVVSPFGMASQMRGPGPRLEKTKDGHIKLMIDMSHVIKRDEEEPEGPKPREVDPEQLKELVKTVKGQFEQWQNDPEAEQQMAGLDVSLTLHTAGGITSVSYFKKVDDKTARMTLKGADLKKLILEASKKEGFFESMARAQMSEGMSPETFKELFGFDRIEAVGTLGEAALFDYKAEVAPARKTWATFAEENKPKLPEPLKKGEGFETVAVAGVQTVLRVSPELNVRPFGQDKAGLNVVLVGKLPGRIYKVTGVEVTRAVDLAGRDIPIMGAGDNDERMMYSMMEYGSEALSSDGKVVTFTVELGLPSPEKPGFGTLAGKLSYVTNRGFKQLDTGQVKLEVGATSEEGTVKVLGFTSQETYGQLKVQFNLPREQVVKVQCLGPDGQDIGSPSPELMDDQGKPVKETIYSVSIWGEDQLPTSVRFRLHLHEQVSTGTIPFELKNIDLLGRPVGGR